MESAKAKLGLTLVLTVLLEYSCGPSLVYDLRVASCNTSRANSCDWGCIAQKASKVYSPTLQRESQSLIYVYYNRPVFSYWFSALDCFTSYVYCTWFPLFSTVIQVENHLSEMLRNRSAWVWNICTDIMRYLGVEIKSKSQPSLVSLEGTFIQVQCLGILTDSPHEAKEYHVTFQLLVSGHFICLDDFSLLTLVPSPPLSFA